MDRSPEPVTPPAKRSPVPLAIEDLRPQARPLAMRGLTSRLRLSCLDAVSSQTSTSPDPANAGSARPAEHDGQIADKGAGGDAEPESAGGAAEPEMSLEDFETQAFNRTQVIRKKPAASSKTLSACPKAGAKKEQLKLGCPRCRGSVKGCSTCKNPDYNGFRLHGKAAYEKHMKMKTDKKHTKKK